MGIQDRDYYREGPSFLDRVGEQGAVVWLIAITCGVFFGQMLTGVVRSPLVALGAYDSVKIQEGEVWRLVTPIFLHASILHILFNMFMLYFAGSRVEKERGSFEFAAFYLVGGVFANAVYFAIHAAGIMPHGRAVGASGAVMAALVLYACHFPRQKVLLFAIIPMPAWGMVALFVVLDLLGTLGGNLGRDNVAFVVHLAGAAFGGLYFLSGWQFKNLFAGRARSQSRVRPRLRVVPAPPPVEEDDPPPEPVRAAVPAAPRPTGAPDEQLEAKVDAVLAKVSKYGKECLTPEEHEILRRASEIYKKKRQ